MAEVVEGDWKDFRFKMAEPEDSPGILDHLAKNFYRDEPLCNHLGYDEVVKDDFHGCVLGALGDNLSFIVVHKPTGKIAGVRITALVKRGDHSPVPVFKSQKSTVILAFIIKASDQAKIFEAYPDVDECADLFMASVDKEFRGQGIATEMYNRSIKLFKAKGIRLCKSVFSSPYTRKAGANLGFTELCRLYLKDYKDEGGNLHFPNCRDDEVITTAALRIT